MPRWLPAVLGLVMAAAFLPLTSTPASGEAREQTISITDTAIVPNRVVSAPGLPLRLTVRNDGTVPHGLVIEGRGLQARLDPFPPGETRVLDVTLSAGEYEMYDPAPGARERGLRGTVLMQATGAVPPPTDTPVPTPTPVPTRTPTPTPVPPPPVQVPRAPAQLPRTGEPPLASLALFGAGFALLGLGAFARRRR